MPLDEDLRRYTAPPDNPPEERRYYRSDIVDYFGFWVPTIPGASFTLDEVREMLKEAADSLTDEEYGIDML